MGVALEERLLVARDPDQRFEDASRIGVERQDVADRRAVLEQEPSASLEARDQPAGRGALDLRFVGRRGRVLVEIRVEGAEFLAALGPKVGGAQGVEGEFDRGFAHQMLRLTFELHAVEASQDVPVQRGVRARQRGEKARGNAVEKRRQAVETHGRVSKLAQGLIVEPTSGRRACRARVASADLWLSRPKSDPLRLGMGPWALGADRACRAKGP